MKILFSAPDRLWAEYHTALQDALNTAGIAATLTREAVPSEVDYIIYAPNNTLRNFAPFTHCKAVLSLWAGVETIAANSTLTQPLCRMVDPGLRLGMRDYVVGHVMRAHLGMDRYIHGTNGAWVQTPAPLARDRRVTVLGLGELGAFCATALRDLGFAVTGWSRRAKEISGITCLYGDDGLTHALERAEILVLLLPDTSATANLLNADRLILLAQGAQILNPGRGTLIDDGELLNALNSGQIAHATLDVFRREPLPPDHPFWHHPQITVTPHIAAATRPETAAQVIAENIRRSEAGEPLLHQVDRNAGY